MKKSLILTIVTFGSGLAAGLYFARYLPPPPHVETYAVVSDTIIRHDTIEIIAPQPIKTSQIGNIERRLALVEPPLCRRDTISRTYVTHIRDSADVSVPIVSKTYSDSAFRAVVSGFEPSLDTLEIRCPVTIVTQRKQPRWAIGVTAGATLSRSGQVSPGIAIGLTYTLATF